MADMSPEKNEMPIRDPSERITDFYEVTLGYSEETALKEAARCLSCKNMPCVAGCPVGVKIPLFIDKIKEMDFEGAYKVISEASSLPAVCGRVCPQERQCEAKCVRGIKGEPVGIGRLERFVADWHNSHNNDNITPILNNGHKACVVGSGPSGLACAGDLAKKGYEVTVFEALHTAGGVLVYGIPEFRLPKEIVRKEIENLKNIGVKIETNVIIGKTLTVDELFAMGFEAIFIGSGAGLPRFMGIEGESLCGVFSANEFLTRNNLMKAYKAGSATPVMATHKTVVVGGGNVAMDAARTARRLGAEVTVFYRRTEKELPARREEIEHAKEEGIAFKFLTNPVKIEGQDGWVKTVICEEMELSAPDETGRARPVPKPDSSVRIEADSVIMAIGTSPNPLIKDTTEGLDTNKKGCIVVNEETLATSREGIYAGGDAVTGAATVILAMGAGKAAASSIDKYIMNK